MAINKEQLYSDIHKNYIKLIRNEKKSSIKYLQNYNRLLIVLEDAFGETINDTLFLDYKKMHNYENEINIKNILYFEKMIKSIDKDLLRISKNYRKCFVKNIDYYSDFDSNIKLKLYNKKDFLDIILSFYSQYGENIYNTVKKTVDENNIIFLNEFKNHFSMGAGAYHVYDTLSKKIIYYLVPINTILKIWHILCMNLAML